MLCKGPADGGGPSVGLTIYKVGDQDAVTMAEMVRAYVRGRRVAAGDDDAGFEVEWTDRGFGLVTWATKMLPGDRAPAPRRTARHRAYELGANGAPPLPEGCRIATSSDLARFIEGRLSRKVRGRAGWETERFQDRPHGARIVDRRQDAHAASAIGTFQKIHGEDAAHQFRP